MADKDPKPVEKKPEDDKGQIDALKSISDGQKEVQEKFISGVKSVGSSIESARKIPNTKTIEALSENRKVAKANNKEQVSALHKISGWLAQTLFFQKDQARQARDERRRGPGRPSKRELELRDRDKQDAEDMPFTAKLAAGIIGLAAFASALNVDAVLRLPQQVKSIRGMANFVSGVAKIGTLGIGAKVIDNIRLSTRQFGTNIVNSVKNIGKNFNRQWTKTITGAKTGFFKLFGGATDDLAKQTKNISKSRSLLAVKSSLMGVGSGIKDMIKPITDTFGGLFSNVSPKGKLAELISKLGSFLKPVGTLLRRIALPITLVFAVIDGFKGFSEEFEKTGKIVDGLRGAVEGIVDGFIGGLIRLVTGLLDKFLSFLGLDRLGALIGDFGDTISANLKQAVGGIVDFITGIFTFDGARIMKGLKNTVGGVFSGLTDLVMLPINMTINFVKDIFKWGDPDKPFKLQEWFMEDVIGKMWSWMKNLWSEGLPGIMKLVWDGEQNKLFGFKLPQLPSISGMFDKLGDIAKGIYNPETGAIFGFDLMGAWQGFKEKILGLGNIMKALSLAGIAAVKAAFPGGESPAEAFKRVFAEKMKNIQPNIEGENELDIEKTAEGKTKIADIVPNEDREDGKVIINNNVIDNKKIANKQGDTYAGNLAFNTDPYLDHGFSNYKELYG